VRQVAGSGSLAGVAEVDLPQVSGGFAAAAADPGGERLVRGGHLLVGTDVDGDGDRPRAAARAAPPPASMAMLTGKSGLDGEPLVPANGSPAG
jgi:hypothetical protein